MPTITPGNQALSLAQAQTGIMDAAAHNASTPGAVQISGGNVVGSSGTYNPSTVQTPSAPASNPAMTAANSISTSPNATVATGTPMGNPRSGVVSPIAATTNIVSQKRPTVGKAVTTPTLTGKPVSTPVPTVNSTTPVSPLAPITPIAQRTGTSDQFPIGTFPTKAVKPVAPTAPAVPVKPTTPDLYSTATPEQKSNADQMLKMIDPTGQLNPAAQADIRNAIIDGKEASIQGVANAYNLNYQNIKDTTDAYKLTRDVAMQDQFNKQQTDQKLAQSKQEYDTAWRQQKDKLEATANNMAVLQDTTGRLQSRNMVGAITQQLDEQQRLLENINQNQQWAAQDIVNTAKYNHDLLANQYNDRMAGYDASMGAKIKALSDTGMANTMDGLKAAQSLVEQTLNQKMETGYTYAKALENATKIVQMQIKQRTPNAEMSNTMNDGYLHNDAGEIIMGAKGEPLAYNPQKKVQSTVSDGKGGMIAIYTDGTHGPIYEGKLATDSEVQNYAKMVQQYGVAAINILPDQVKAQVMGYLGQNGMSPTREAQWGVIGQHYDENTGVMVNDYGFINTYNQTTNSGMGGGGGGGGGGGMGSTSSNGSQGVTTQANVGNLLNNVSEMRGLLMKQESGNPKALGGIDTKYGRALGMYQVMPFQLEKIGLKLDPKTNIHSKDSLNNDPVVQQFLNNPDLQTKLADTIIQGNIDYVSKKYPNDTADVKAKRAIAMYYGGGGGAAAFGTEGGNNRQNNGAAPSINGYVNSVISRMPKTSNTQQPTAPTSNNPLAPIGDFFKQLVHPEQEKQNKSNFTDKQVEQFQTNGVNPPSEYKSLVQKSRYADEYAKWREENPQILSKDEKKDVAGVQNNLQTDPRRKDYLSMSSKEKTLNGIQDRLSKGTATPQDKQQLINDFAKILDPTSVVREGEYALAGKYSQSKLTAMGNEIANYFTTNGPLSNDAAKMLAEGVARRQEAINEANNDAITEALANAKYFLGRDVPPEALGVKIAQGKSDQSQNQEQSTQVETFKSSNGKSYSF